MKIYYRTWTGEIITDEPVGRLEPDQWIQQRKHSINGTSGRVVYPKSTAPRRNRPLPRNWLFLGLHHETPHQ